MLALKLLLETLLDESSNVAPLDPNRQKAPGLSDCSTKPKACANCSCGRAELENEYGDEEAKKILEQGQVL